MMPRETPPQVHVLTVDDGLWGRVASILGEEGLAVARLPEGGLDGAALPGAPAALVVDGRGRDVDALLTAIREATSSGGAGPLFLLMPEIPSHEQQIGWLERGVWDVVRVPLDAELFAARMSSVLRASTAARGEAPGVPWRDGAGGADGDGPEPYSWRVLVPALDETLALARRRGQAVTCVALAVRTASGPHRRLAERLARFALRRLRRSDLVGCDGAGSVLVVLPETDAAGATKMLRRFVPALAYELAEWGVDGLLETRIVESWGAGDGEALLRSALRAQPVDARARAPR